MSNSHNANKKRAAMPSVWKNRRKPFLIIEIILALTATIFAIINFVLWNIDLPLISSLIILLVGAVFVLRGIESRLNKEKGYKITLEYERRCAKQRSPIMKNDNVYLHYILECD